MCVPFDLRLRRVDDELEWGPFGVRNALSYVGLASPDSQRVTVGIASDLDGWNLNPLWIEVRDRATIVDLLYDRLAVVSDSEIHPWLAAGWDVVERDSAGTVLLVHLREELYTTYPSLRLLTQQANVNTNAFPSLHTSMAVTVALVGLWTRDQFPRFPIIAIPTTVSIVIATMYLGLHWLLDVIAGIVLAALAVWVGVRWTAPD